jgi:hypothetical protein
MLARFLAPKTMGTLCHLFLNIEEDMSRGNLSLAKALL